jgi:hypothetical protein
MSNLDDEKEKKQEGQSGSGRPATKSVERPKPGQQKDPSKAHEGPGEEGEAEGGTETTSGQQGQQKQEEERE